jgi:hypothetical protein
MPANESNDIERSLLGYSSTLRFFLLPLSPLFSSLAPTIVDTLRSPVTTLQPASALETIVQATAGFQGRAIRVRRAERFSHKMILGRDGYLHREVGPISRIIALRVATLSFFSYSANIISIAMQVSTREGIADATYSSLE